ncbi:uncharacterized protein [Leptinotarsa decemlineata]|uniref:uncharacterized protein n=1 Tax=Leptinotarsa decemlineata TaxID=7539 RepID=UPI003D30703F
MAKAKRIGNYSLLKGMEQNARSVREKKHLSGAEKRKKRLDQQNKRDEVLKKTHNLFHFGFVRQPLENQPFPSTSAADQTESSEADSGDILSKCSEQANQYQETATSAGAEARNESGSCILHRLEKYTVYHVFFLVVLKTNHSFKQDGIQSLQSKVNDLDQASHSNNLEIQGIPEKRNEDLLNIVEKIGAYINCNVTPHTVDYALRVQSNHNSSNTTSKNIIVKFTSRKERDLFLMAVKTKRIRNNNSAKMSLDGISDAFYINEHLTLANKLLYRDVRAAARDKQFKYVWVKNGVSFCRKDDSSRIIAIKSQELIEKM